MSGTPKWTRPNGPLNVWKIVDGYESLANGTKKAVKFSIQEVPDSNERRREVIDFMNAHFLDEEPCSKSLKMREDPYGPQDFLSVCKYSLNQGVTVACYKLDSSGTIEELVGADIVFVKTPDTIREFEEMKKYIKSQSFITIWDTFMLLASKADVCKIYNVDQFLMSMSIYVSSTYRGQKLGVHILEARSPLGKKYGFKATTALFTGPASQIQAKRAGFEEKLSVNYADLLDEKGNPKFPNIDSECAKMMMKRIP